VLFGVGSGGDPGRHLPMLEHLADNGFKVVAPHYEMLQSPFPTERELEARAARMRLALDTVSRPGVRVAGVGHSIGAAMLVALAGGRAWGRSGGVAAIARDERLQRIVLMAPAAGFFRGPGGLDDVKIPILAFAGTEDTITPPSTAMRLKQGVSDASAVEVRVVEGAGHFSFMNTPPPNTTEPLDDREAFLAGLADEVLEFLVETGPVF
jgi:alpha-beta hydrolase superfamily lysophospholipase